MGHLNQNFTLVPNENTPESPNNVENFKWVQKQIEESTDLQARLAEGMLPGKGGMPTGKVPFPKKGKPLHQVEWAK